MAAWAQASGLANTGKGGCLMRIEKRDLTITYTRAIRDDKLRLVLDWLLEFQFSSLDLLARRISTTTRSSYDFFRSLLKQHLIKEFKSVHTNQARYLMLTKTGMSIHMLQVRQAGRVQRPNLKPPALIAEAYSRVSCMMLGPGA